MSDRNDSLNPIECAKLIRTLLKEKYSNFTFNVSTRTMGEFARVTIEWEDGVSYDDIKKLTNLYIYKENAEDDNGIKYKAKYIILNRLFTYSILDSLADILNVDNVNDEKYEELKKQAKSILLTRFIPINATKVIKYDAATDVIEFNVKPIITSTPTGVNNFPSSFDTFKQESDNTEKKVEYEKTIIEEKDSIKIYRYSEKSFALIGENTKKYKDAFSSLNIRYNSNLTIDGKRVKGWISSFKKLNEVLNIIQG